MGFDLFDRSRRPPALTHRGQAILPEVNALLQHNNWLSQVTDNLYTMEETTLSIAVEDIALGPGLEEAIMDLSRQFQTLTMSHERYQPLTQRH